MADKKTDVTGLEIAVIGMTGRFPGAGNIDEFWNNLKNGVESIAFFSMGEVEDAEGEPQRLNNPHYVKAAGVLQEIEYFDPYFFGYTPGEVEVMDPQMRIFHECVWEALEDTGYHPGSFPGRIGLYAGAGSSFYWEALTRFTQLGKGIDFFTRMNLNNKDFLSMRISYKLDLKGPVFTVNTACSTSLVAIHLAVQGLLNGECEIALAGGIQVSLPQKTGYLYEKGMINSPDGHCRAFDAKAQGTLLGKGAGVVALKLLEEAAAQGDNIYAVVKGTAINNDGIRKAGFQAPSIEGQAEVISAALHTAEVEPETISYIETHGTGTELGDPVEIEALKLVFNTDPNKNKRNYCAIGSVKSNIGHLDSAAGVAGFIKAVLALKHRLIPPSLHFETPNPKIDLENSPFYVNQTLEEWKNEKYPRRAGVSSFGIGGTNAHAVLEEWPGHRERSRDSQDEKRPQLLLLSAKTSSALDKMTGNLVNYLRQSPNPLADTAYTLQVGRKRFQYRKIAAGTGVREMIDELTSPSPSLVQTFFSHQENLPVVYMFPGQGSQYVNMGLELYRTETIFRDEMDRCFEILKPIMGYDIKEILYPSAGGHRSNRSDKSYIPPIDQTEITQPLIFAFEYALAKLLMKWGIKPYAMIGHSIGELAAACLSGVFSLEGALKVAALRGKLMQQMPPGSMVSVPLPEARLKPLLKSKDELSLAAVNSSSLCVISGPTETVAAFTKELEEKGHRYRQLHTSHAFHSKMMGPILTQFEAELGKVKLNKPEIPYLSNVTGDWITVGEAANPGNWVKHVRETVRFADGLEKLLEKDHLVFIEVGPGKTLGTFVRQHNNKKPTHLAVNLIKHPKEEISALYFFAASIGRLWLHGVTPDWSAIHEGEKRYRVSLPTYPFERRYFPMPSNPFNKETLDSEQMPVPGSSEYEGAPFTNILKKHAKKTSFWDDAPKERLENVEQRSGLSTVYVAPNPDDQTAHILIRAWQDFFGIKGVGMNDDFFELGGDSLKAMNMLANIHKKLEVEVSPANFFKQPTIKGLIRYITSAEKSKYSAVQPVEKQDYYVLSSAQQRMYVLQQMDKTTVAYNLTPVMRLEGNIEKEKLEGTFHRLIRRHESFSTFFAEVEGEPVQRIREEVEFAVAYYEAGEKEAGAIVSEFTRPFDLTRAPLLRAALITGEASRFILILDIHHIILDGISIGVLIDEFISLYEGKELAEPRLQYKDYAAWESREKQGESIKKQETFWMKTFEGEIPVLELPTDYMRPALQSFAGSTLLFQLDRGRTRSLKALAARQGATLYMILLSIYDIFLSKLSGQEVIVVGTPTAGRRHADLERVIGMFVNTLALKNYPGGEKTFIEFLGDVKETTLAAFANQDYQYETLVERVTASRDPSRNPLFDAMLILQNVEIPTVKRFDWALQPYQKGRDTAKFDLTLEYSESDDTLECIVEYCTRLFKEETIQRFIRYLKQITSAVLEQPGSKISQIDMLAEEEKKQLVIDFNETAEEFPTDKTIYRLLEEQVDKNPDHTVLVFKDKTLTYRHFDERANQLAHYLGYEKGVAVGDRVAVLMERCPELIISLTGVMKGGAAYVPLDPTLPGGRLRVMFKDASIGVVISQEKFREKLLPLQSQCPGFRSLVCMDGMGAERSEINRRPITGPGVPGSTNPAYVMYTSGSSGTPKGVVVEHRTIVNTLIWRKNFYDYHPGDVSLQNPPYFFDSSVTDIFTPLLGGARLVLISEEERLNSRELGKIIKINRVSHLIFIPAFYNVLLEEIAHDLTGIRMITAAGEYFPDGLIKKHFQKLPRVRIFNEYGPTENSVNTTAYELKPGSVKALIGVPISNVGVYVLDRYLWICPIGVSGEMCLAGASLARGYLNNPEITADKFLTRCNRSYKSYISNRLYKTGDMGKWQPDGNLEFLGRLDAQVKIRGIRVETGEIENHLLRHGDIKEAVVLALNGSGAEKYLCAYVVFSPIDDKKEETGKITALKKYLEERLPPYMIPLYFAPIDKIPLTTNGKIDRKALPIPAAGGGDHFAAPRDEIESKLVDIWEKVLGKTKKSLGIDDNFFAVGGDSIKAIQIISRLNSAGYKTGIKTLFQYPTIRELAPRLTKVETLADQTPVTGRVPLSPIQEWYFSNSPIYPHHYNHAVMFYTKERIDPDVIKAVFTKIQEHHDALRMTYKREIGKGERAMVQTNHGLDYPLSIQEFDMREQEHGAALSALEEKANRIQSGIDLENGPLMKLGLFHLDDGDRLLIVIHHLVIDGISWRILFEDMDRLMDHYKNNQAVQLPLKTDSFKTWVEKLHQYASSEKLLKEKTYWQELAGESIQVIEKDFVGVDSEDTFTNILKKHAKKTSFWDDAPKERHQTDREWVGGATPLFVKDTANVSFHLEAEETGQLLTWVNQAFGTEINDILLTALGLAVNKTWGHNRLLISLEGHGRENLLDEIDISRTIGWFTSEYPVLLDVSFASDLGRQIKEIKEMLRKIPGKGTGYGILKYLTPGDSKKEKAFELKPQLSFNYLGQLEADVRHTGFEIAEEPVGQLVNQNEKSVNELEINGLISHNRLNVSIAYSRKQYKAKTIEALSTHFKSGLLRVIAYCASKEKREFTPSDFTYPHLCGSIEDLERLNRQYPGTISDLYPLTPMQQGMLFHTVYDNAPGAYFEQTSYRLQGELEVKMVKKSLDELFQRHHILRTAIVYEGVETPFQVILQERGADVYYEDLSGITGGSETKEQLIEEFKTKDKLRGFDPGKDVLMRVSILQLQQREHEVIWSFHHILMDGWCIGILNKEFFEIYSSLQAGEEPQLPSVTPYRNYIRWLAKQNRETSRAYWQRYLDSYEETVPVPGMKARKDTVEYDKETLNLEFDREKTLMLKAAASNNHVTLNTFIQAIWAILLGKYNDKEDVVFGSVVSGRPGELEGVEAMVGLFINTIPVRIRYSGQTRFKQLLQLVQADALGSEPYHYHPLAEIQSQSLVKKDLINHILIFENYPTVEQIRGYENKKNSRQPFQISHVEVSEQTNYDFNVIAAAGAQLAVQFNYNGNVFDSDLVVRIANHFRLLLEQALDNEEVAIGELTLLSTREKQQILYQFNDTRARYPGDKTIHKLFEEQVERTPAHIAVIGNHEEHEGRREVISVTYRELNKRSNQLAQLLKEKSVLTDTIVGIMVERSIEMIMGILGILKAGGAYLPIDPAYPGERIRYIQEDSGVEILLTGNVLSSWLSEARPAFICPKGAPSHPHLSPWDNAPVTSLAYIIYTSGSTGRPRGVMVEHRPVVNRLNWMQRAYPIGERDVILQKTPITFDVSVWELFWWSFYGASLCLAGPGEEKDPAAIAATVARNHVTTMHFVPSMLNAFLEYLEASTVADQGVKTGGNISLLTDLRQVFSSGEALKTQQVEKFNQLLDTSTRTKLINLYGPTEATVDVSYFDCPAGPPPKNIPIGKPIDNIQLYIVDKYLHWQPVGTAGELCIGGVGLARGYLNNPGITAQKFDRDLWDSRDYHDKKNLKETVLLSSKLYPRPYALGSRLYKTGDLARWLADGNIEFLGRMDFQVKIRGFRIELEEIENCLKTHPCINDAIVINMKNNGRQYLCAYVTAAPTPGKGIPSNHELKEHLEGKLPGYMIPACFVAIEHIPLNPSGKVDRNQLPRPLETDFHTLETYEAPVSDIQRIIAEIWQEVLGREKIGIRDNFFDLGGNSLDFIKISNKLTEKLERDIPVLTLFTYPTIDSLELYLTREQGIEEDDPGLINEGKDLMRLTLNKLDKGD